MCTGYAIKKIKSNATNCDEDIACDGETTVPNENHTVCGKYYIKKHFLCEIKYDVNYHLMTLLMYLLLSVCNGGYYRSDDSCMKCSGDTTKPTKGDARNCSVTCDRITNVPNENRTACGKSCFTS